MEEQCDGQGQFMVLADVEGPYGALHDPDWEQARQPFGEALPGFLAACGALHGSYTLDDRTVFVFDRMVLEVMRGAGLYATSLRVSRLDSGFRLREGTRSERPGG